MNFALALAVAGLAFSAASVCVTSPLSQVGDVDVVGLQDAAEVGLVRRARAQPLDRRLLVAEGFKEGERELRGVERLLREVGDGLFDLDGVQLFAPSGAGAGWALRRIVLLRSTRIHDNGKAGRGPCFLLLVLRASSIVNHGAWRTAPGPSCNRGRVVPCGRRRDEDRAQ